MIANPNKLAPTQCSAQINPQAILQQYFGYPQFRSLQGKIVEAITTGHDVLTLLPTGGGKSLCYQIPGLWFALNQPEIHAITLVISPLIALMKDQVDHLLAKNIPATFLNHTLSAEEVLTRTQDIRASKYIFVYVSPERLQTASFVQLCREIRLQLIAIDEAHCISQWGHDFRPEYMQIAGFLKKLPTRPIVAAFTATAPPRVRDEIVTALGLNQPCIFQDTFWRPNLRFVVYSCADALTQEQYVLQLLLQFRGKSGIIYCATRKKVRDLTAWLIAHHITCAAYHAGLAAEQRAHVQDEFLADHIPLIIATNAFGMGVDKPNIRFVIHFHFPSQLEAYYQEAGRAGRDGKEARCIILFYPPDIQLLLAIGRKHSHAVLQKKLTPMLRFLTTSHCRTQILMSYLGEKKLTGGSHRVICQHCDCCAPRLKTLIPIAATVRQTQHLVWQLHEPQTRYEYLQLPGVGQGWLEQHYAKHVINHLPNVLRVR